MIDRAFWSHDFCLYFTFHPGFSFPTNQTIRSHQPSTQLMVLLEALCIPRGHPSVNSKLLKKQQQSLVSSFLYFNGIHCIHSCWLISLQTQDQSEYNFKARKSPVDMCPATGCYSYHASKLMGQGISIVNFLLSIKV